MQFTPTNLILTVTGKRCTVTITNLDSVPVEKIYSHNSKDTLQKIYAKLTKISLARWDKGWNRFKNRQHEWSMKRQVKTRVFFSFIAQYSCEWQLLFHIFWWTTASSFPINTISDCITPTSSLYQATQQS